MKKEDLDELLELEKRRYFKLGEALSLTGEMADSVDRQDDVSLRLQLSMREKPVMEMQEIESFVRLKRFDLEAEEAEEFDRLLRGEETDDPATRAVADQLATNRRVLERLVELDRTLNMRLCGERSRYSAAE